MKTYGLIFSLSILLCAFLLSCDDDDAKSIDDREKFAGIWEGPGDLTCESIPGQESILEVMIFNGDDTDELVLDIEWTINDIVAEADNVIAVLSENGFVFNQTVEVQYSNGSVATVTISGGGALENGELEFSIFIPHAVYPCDLTATIPKK